MAAWYDVCMDIPPRSRQDAVKITKFGSWLMSAVIVVIVVFVVPMSANWFGADVAMNGAIMGVVTPAVFAMMGAGLVMNLY